MGQLALYATEYLQNDTNVVYEIRRGNGDQFKIPLQILFDRGGEIFPGFDSAQDPTQLPASEDGRILGISENILAAQESLIRRRQKRNEEAGRPVEGHDTINRRPESQPIQQPTQPEDVTETKVNPRAMVTPNKTLREIAVNAQNVLPAVDATLAEVNNTGIPNDVLKPVVARLILQESNFNPTAVNPKDGGVGLFQITNPNLKAQLKERPEYQGRHKEL